VPLSLGPLPPHLRELVARWIDEQYRAHPPTANDPILGGLHLFDDWESGYYLDLAGNLYELNVQSGVTRLDDDRTRIMLIVASAKKWPELGEWLLPRPSGSSYCRSCQGTGFLPPPLPSRVQCWDCLGLGWKSIDS
jgi:hypothetical protein